MRIHRMVCLFVALLPGGIRSAAAQDARPAAAEAPAQAASAPAKLTVGKMDVSVNWRSRLEMWDWFEGPVGNTDYAFFHSLLRAGIGRSTAAMDWRVEVSVPALVGLPDAAVAPAPMGQLGLGGTYYAANSGRVNTAAIFPKQAFVQFNRLGRFTVKLGRFEFFDGTEARIPDPAVAAIVQGRVAHRLISNFGFTVAQRSYDGGLVSWNAGANGVTAFAARPTAGVFQVKGAKELDIEIYYGAYNRALRIGRDTGSFRAFGIGYVDHRASVLKTDNRPAELRAADRESIALATYGANYVHVMDLERRGKLDFTGWAVAQAGSWGNLTQRSGAFVGEIGWQPRMKLSPWVRGGYSWGSGDGNPLDGRNGTFFQLLTTPRQYARLPFYNMMNNQDAYGIVTLRPNAKVTLRGEVHNLRLANRADLWYGGGGAFQESTFGYAGRPSSNRQSLASVWDVSADTQPTPHIGVNLYYGHASGGGVVRGAFPNGAGASFGYLETVVRF